MKITYLLLATTTVLELLSSAFVVNGLVGKKKTISIFKTSIFIVATVAYILMMPDALTTGSYVLFLLYIKWSYNESWKNSLITLILCIILVGLVELVSFFPFAFVMHGWLSDIMNNLFASLCSMILCFVVARFIPIQHLKNWCEKKEVTYIAVVFFSLLLMLTTIIDFKMTLELDVGDYIYITACVVLMWLLVVRLMRYRYEEKIRKKYFDAFCSVIDQMKRRQHKFRNQVDAVYSLHSLYDDYDTLVEEQRKYLGRLVDYEMPTDVLVLENPIIIAHIFEKITEAQEAGLRIRMKLSCSLANCGIDDIHMIEILGTLLDNAIQDMIATEQKEFLYIEAKYDSGIIVRVANPHKKMRNQEIQQMFENGYSTKGEGRGIGLYHVRKLVQKYKVDLAVENRNQEEQNYICFSLIIKESTL